MRIAVLFPEHLGTYGDRGNALVLRQRLAWRSVPAEVVPVRSGRAVPAGCDVYLLGGAEDAVLPAVLGQLRTGGGLAAAVGAGAAVLAVCAGLQLLGETLPGPARPLPGLGLLPCRSTDPGPGATRCVGPVVVAVPGLGPDPVVGFENHRARTALAPGAEPLGVCRAGRGNAVPDEHGRTVDGVRSGRILGTYLHGPVLALNPALADHLLELAIGPLPPIPADAPRSAGVADTAAASARRQRLLAAGFASL